ncbi:MAG TPA: biopolymer transporter ExbD [Candidatus Udaeobacter sp.]|nr:biopolymer transporter ExbD [Candidatus Udaeobacter sp.]
MNSMNPGQRGPAGIDDVNMTPLIDVSLVLVVILMVAMPMVFQSSIAVRQAAASGSEAPLAVQAERVEVAIVSEDSLRVNRLLIPRAQFSATIFSLINRSTDPIVVVECADQVSHGTFVSVVDEAKSCGAAQIAVVGR